MTLLAGLTAVCAAGFCCAAAHAQTFSFAPPVSAFVSGASTGTGVGSSGLAVADFNGDQIPDLAVTYNVGQGSTAVTVLLGNGDGTFRHGVEALSGESLGYPSTLFAGDFNGDGKVDLVYSGTPTAAAVVAYGNGDGTFGPPMAVPGCRAVSVVADFNRDGKTDLICGIAVLLGQSSGGFEPGGLASSNSLETAVLTADFNEDGIPDVLLATGPGGAMLALGKGDGTFLPESQVSGLVAGPYAGQVVAGDFNEDAKTDVAGICYRDGSVCVVPGNGDGTFGTPIHSPWIPAGISAFQALADFNHDGHLDVVSGNTILPGNGDGTFGMPIYLKAVGAPCATSAERAVSPSGFFPCGYSTASEAVADFNGDGLPDLATASLAYMGTMDIAASVDVLLNDSPGDGLTSAGVSAATYTTPVGVGSIVSAFGVDLAAMTESASTVPLPTELGGIRVHVTDRIMGDQLAPLLYVSPTQINYVMPSFDEYPAVSIERVGSPYVPKGIAVSQLTLGGGFFNVGGVPEAGEVTVTPAGQIYQSLNGPIDVAGGNVYLVLYGTGFEYADANFSDCSIGSTILRFSYLGPQGTFAGLDQANLMLPAALAGSGAVTLNCAFMTMYSGTPDAVTAYGVTSGSNPVSLTIQ